MQEISRILFSHNPKMIKLGMVIDEIAKTDIAVLIKGETGTGKELVAETISNQIVVKCLSLR